MSSNHDFGAVELIYAGRQHRLLRARRAGDGARVVLKTAGLEADTEGAARALRNEYDLLRDLDVEGVARAFALGVRFSPSTFVALHGIVRDAHQDPRLRAAAVHALGRMLDEDAAYRLAELTRASNWRLRPEWLDTLVQSTL